jgi:hypothetical protein
MHTVSLHWTKKTEVVGVRILLVSFHCTRNLDTFVNKNIHTYVTVAPEGCGWSVSTGEWDILKPVIPTQYLRLLKKAVPLYATKAIGGRMYTSYSFSTSALYEGEWSASRPGRALPPGKGPPVPTVQEAGWAPEPVWTQRPEPKPTTAI